jgi:phosphotransferase system HPr-like phosphotransfer protein
MAKAYKKPLIAREGDCVIIRNVPIHLDEGICCRSAALIARAFGRYSIRLRRNIEGIPYEVPIDNIRSLLSLEAGKGSILEIRVKDHQFLNQLSEELALRLYSGLTTKGFYPDFDRDEEQ